MVGVDNNSHQANNGDNLQIKNNNNKEEEGPN